MFTYRVGFLGSLLLLGAVFSYSVPAQPEESIVKNTHILNPRLFGPREMLARAIEPHSSISLLNTELRV